MLYSPGQTPKIIKTMSSFLFHVLILCKMTPFDLEKRQKQREPSALSSSSFYPSAKNPLLCHSQTSFFVLPELLFPSWRNSLEIPFLFLGMCCICYASEADAQFVPCSHRSCHGCISRHLLNCLRCFFCNATVLEVVKVDEKIL